MRTGSTIGVTYADIAIISSIFNSISSHGGKRRRAIAGARFRWLRRKTRSGTRAPFRGSRFCDGGADMNARASHRSAKCSKSEEADDYHAVITHLNDRWRVVVCAAGVQWVLQRRRGERRGTARWEGRSYCRTGQALNRLSRRHAGAIDPTAAAILASLPERIENVHREARL